MKYLKKRKYPKCHLRIEYSITFRLAYNLMLKTGWEAARETPFSPQFVVTTIDASEVVKSIWREEWRLQ